MKSVAEVQFRIIRADHGLQCFVPVIFSDVFFSVADLTLHTVLLNYRLNFSAPNSTQVSIEEIWAKILFPDNDTDLELTAEVIQTRYRDFSGKLQSIARSLRAYILLTKDQLPSTLTFDESLIPAECELVSPLQWEVCTPRQLAEQVLREVSEVAAYMCQANLCLKELVKVGHRTVRAGLKRKYYAELKERYELNISKQATLVPAYAFNAEKSRFYENLNASKLIRRSQAFLRFEPMAVEDLRFEPDEEQPIVFEELAYTENSDEVAVTGLHLLVLVHGYQGNCFDMSLMKNYLQMAYPHTVFHASTVNEGHHETTIQQQAERLARDVLSTIEECGIEARIGKLSFVGHSMGGLVIRAALPYLEKYAGLMHSFISLSTPHLGTAGKSNKLIGFGIWFLKKWKKSASLRELSMTDATDRTKAYLLNLSSTPGLNWFRYVVFLSSHQDSYVPFESARVEVSPQMAADHELGGIFLQMAANILMQLKQPLLYRIDVNFSMKKRSLDSMIGRRAHIQFLENEALMRTLVFSYPQFFS
jgi:pimeloyl-ACP methyl ester carboxylesterase